MPTQLVRCPTTTDHGRMSHAGSRRLAFCFTFFSAITIMLTSVSTTTTDDHAVYRHPPVALVVAETRFPGEVGTALPPAALRALVDLLGVDWVVDQVQPPVQINIGMPGQLPLSTAPPGTVLRFSNRDRTSAIGFTTATTTIETTAYGNWPAFRSTLELALTATERLLRPAGITRAGIRYIDEVRAPDGDGPGWGQWLPDLMPPGVPQLSETNAFPVAWSGAVQYSIGQDRFLVLRYGPQPAQPGFFVHPDRPLRRVGPRPVGAFFLLDFDASWEPRTVPAWETGDLFATYDQLRRPVRLLFDSVIPERLVDEVFNREED